jgi:1,2-dihydroxy-3-keto-5-methylthiopentene dioxygenase
MRFFKGEPVWTPHNRGKTTDEMGKRVEYIQKLGQWNHLGAYVLGTTRPVTKDYLASLGILHWKIDIKDVEKLNAVRQSRNRSYNELLLKNDDKLKNLANEHLGGEEELWYFLSGSGHYDFRGKKDEWIRVQAGPSNLFIIPAGLYHRFTPEDTNLSIRLYSSSLPHPRSSSIDQSPIRGKYLESAKPTAYGRTNKVITIPGDFDRIIQSIDSNSNHNETPVLVYFTAADDPATGQPWCPDARKAEPILETALGELERNFVFVKIPIIRSEYKDNPKYFYRTHPTVRLKKVPTLVLWKNGSVHQQLVETELHEPERVRSFLKFQQAAL